MRYCEAMIATTTILAVGLPTEALLVFGLIGMVVLILGLKSRPKMTLAILLIAVASWLYIANAEMINDKFMSLSQAKMDDR